MAKITRGAGNIKAFASGATVGSRTVFGGTTSSDTLTDNANSDYFKGWEIVGPNEFPTLEDFNAMGYTLGQYIAYLHQQGVAEWDSGQEYHLGSVVVSDSKLFICKTNSFTSAAAPATDTANWSKVLSDNDFNDIITASEVIDNLTSTDTNKPLSANQGKVLNDTTVKLTGDQTIAGVKTFSSAPKSSVVGSASNDLVRADQIVTSAWNIYDVSGSRVIDTWYQNNTSGPIHLHCGSGFNRGWGVKLRKIGNTVVPGTNIVAAANNNTAPIAIWNSTTLIIPPGFEYLITAIGGMSGLPTSIVEVRL